PGKKQVISVQYINLSTTGSVSGAERSYVGIEVFSTEAVDETVQGYRMGFFLVTLISLVIGLIIAQYLSAYISRPIEMMTEDVGIIVSSSLAHSVRVTGLDETEKLRSSINHLVAFIKDHVHAIESRDKALETELSLRKRAEFSLSKANKRMIQLSQITRHDILNQVTALKGYLELIPDAEEKSEVDDYARRATRVLDKIILHLKFTYDYEKIGQEGSAWQNVGQILDQVQDEFFGQIVIMHSCYTVEILADPLIKKVFYNLVDNSVRHGDSADKVRVSFEEREEFGCLVYEDNGSGIPDEYKKKIFERGFGKGTGLGLAFIREVLESNDLTIEENGIFGQGARFEITIPGDHLRKIWKEGECSLFYL
ncbi:MAG: HAMP domain-containing histidine kinase, partial [Methanospirillum sp.]|nr:HAMP domain-containing histidine kinase [Methanospirillum sp.]